MFLTTYHLLTNLMILTNTTGMSHLKVVCVNQSLIRVRYVTSVVDSVYPEQSAISCFMITNVCR